MTEQLATEVAEEITEVVSEDINSLSSLFDDSEEEVEVTATAETEVETEVEKGETEEVEVEAKAEAETTEEVETPATDQTVAGLKAALTAERTKRQEAEGKLKATEAKETAPDPIEDPEGYAEYLEARSDKSSLETRIAISRDVWMDAKDDYLEKEKVFMGLVADSEGNIADESLHKKFLASKNPAKFAYDHATEHQRLEVLRSPDYEAKLRAKIEAELLAKVQPSGKRAVDVPDLTKATDSGSNSTPVETLATIDEMFKDSHF